MDAICINQAQSALTERAAQVARMREVYVNCERDIFWLGDQHDNVVRMVDEINEHFELSPEALSPSPAPTLRSHKNQPEPSKTTKAPNKRGLFLALSTSPVWMRVWIMQELCSAPKIVLQCGETRLDWRLIETLLKDQLSHQDNIPSSRLLRIREERRISATKDVKDSLIGVLTRFRSCLSTDARDRVFGLLGLARNDVEIKVDYTKRFEDVFIDLTKSLMEPCRNLDIMIDREWLHFPGRERDSTRYIVSLHNLGSAI
ncbi:hypothetical protein CC80DRAFT_136804 [Byssothecium circinans]|uniref:Heterokaryon incompatibility domain-containing protein n=1 Tax=Byssothecium circinans TaxID=147558 RepID=A0A6A5TLD3_9PLEO|nr:hypothetical protein CC80DRAFT_136804 [Byssothecium circinans]